MLYCRMYYVAVTMTAALPTETVNLSFSRVLCRTPTPPHGDRLMGLKLTVIHHRRVEPHARCHSG